MDEVYYNSTSRGRIPVSDMCDEHVRRAFKKLLREIYEMTGKDAADVTPHDYEWNNIYVRVKGEYIQYERVK